MAHPWRSLRLHLPPLLQGKGLPLAFAGTLGAAMLTSAPAGLAQANGGATPGARGAQVYCFMRSSGNDHQVSWDAAYAVIKRQSDRLFKTSPQHAAVMITETVVQNPDVYPDCSRYLGDLYRKPEPQPAATDRTGGNPGLTRSERYGQ